MDFDTAFKRLLGFEGGFSDNPSDTGGATRFGVTEAVARSHGYTGEMSALPVDTAKAIYRADYWDKCRCEELPDQVRYSVFDAAVNSGPGQAVKWLQAAVGAKPDGVIGPATLAALNAVPVEVLRSRINGARLGFMTTIPSWGVFSKGWARRIASLLTD